MNHTKDQIDQWLKKLEQESWQLELLVSAFTIFLLIQANMAFSDILIDVQYEYNLSDSFLSFLYIFMALLSLSIKALIIFLILHLLLRGFWIGTIGLRSVQSEVDFDQLNYSRYFTDRLKKKVVSLDNMVVRLDQVCSVMFSFAFLVISIMLSFGLYLLFVGLIGVLFSSVAGIFSGTISTVIAVIAMVLVLVVFLTGILYLIDYFTLGFFKKFSWFSKWYYPIYRFYGLITLAGISRSIYYYLISKFSKRRIRMVYVFALALVLVTWLLEFDQYQYYPDKEDDLIMVNNQYDDLRPPDRHVAGATIPSQIISGGYMPLFIRYDPRDNGIAKSVCPDFEPYKNEGVNWSFRLITDGAGFRLTDNAFEEDAEELINCISGIYEISIGDSLYRDLEFYYYRHPAKKQRGMMTMISTQSFHPGKNDLRINKKSVGEEAYEHFMTIPFWYELH